MAGTLGSEGRKDSLSLGLFDLLRTSSLRLALLEGVEWLLNLNKDKSWGRDVENGASYVEAVIALLEENLGQDDMYDRSENTDLRYGFKLVKVLEKYVLKLMLISV